MTCLGQKEPVILFGNEEFGLGSLFNGISTFWGFFNAKTIFVDEQQWYYLTYR